MAIAQVQPRSVPANPNQNSINGNPVPTREDELRFLALYATDGACPASVPSAEGLQADLEAIGRSVPQEELLNFARVLVRISHKRRHQPQWAAINDMHVNLARICADRIVAEDLPGNVDAALGELRHGR